MVDVERLNRYRDKLNLILTRVSNIDEWLAGLPAKGVASDLKTTLAIYKAYQEIVEASMDVSAMLCRDLSLTPKDDYANLDSLLKKGIFKEDVKDVLMEANGLRNRLIHRYNAIDDLVALSTIQSHLSLLRKFVESVEKWLAAGKL